ncbi:hypothetical protein POM88_021516 [Heracleum sosnowskyi]|uniref:Uncharacterized protein n=1 Tax=Heracleum sosnowskyi TaxID=360622 RepID=A0AAD8IE13_9APIA|nr:hypothetical protein POM88_021516 [Heracleum sosnowskyi]
MEDDFKKVLGISIPLWSFALIFLLLNVYKWHTLVWLSMLPILILLLVEELQWWFNRPRSILFLIHFTLFQNAFQISFFLFTLIEFRHKTCSHKKLPSLVTRVVLGVGLQILCSYITFPFKSWDQDQDQDPDPDQDQDPKEAQPPRPLSEADIFIATRKRDEKRTYKLPTDAVQKKIVSI